MKGFKDTTKMRYYADGGAVKTYSRGDSKRVAPSTTKTAKPATTTSKLSKPVASTAKVAKPTASTSFLRTDTLKKGADLGRYQRGDSKRVAPSKKTAKPVEKTMKPTAKQGKAPLTGGLGQATAAEAKTLGSKMGRKKGYRSFSAKPMFGKG